jgi:hypothetical protein
LAGRRWINRAAKSAGIRRASEIQPPVSIHYPRAENFRGTGGDHYRRSLEI